MEKIHNLILVDDNKIFIDGLETFLKMKTNHHILSCLSSGTELLAFPQLAEADLILLDIEMPGINGFETAKRIGYKFRHIKLIAITMYQDKLYLEHLVGAGFKGFVNKTDIADKIIQVINSVMANRFVFPKEIKMGSIDIN